MFPSRHQCVTQSCLKVLGSATLHQPIEVKIKMLPVLAKYVNVTKYDAKTRAVAGQVVTQVASDIHSIRCSGHVQVAASFNGPNTAIFNALNWLPAEPSAFVREAVFRKMLTLINLLGNKASPVLSIWCSSQLFRLVERTAFSGILWIFYTSTW